ncbi:MAG: hypothetical protein PHD97_00920 [Bacteroidales bacterium]|nr:hypothetical protein [Bacteroidales bacterium]
MKVVGNITNFKGKCLACGKETSGETYCSHECMRLPATLNKYIKTLIKFKIRYALFSFNINSVFLKLTKDGETYSCLRQVRGKSNIDSKYLSTADAFETLIKKWIKLIHLKIEKLPEQELLNDLRFRKEKTKRRYEVKRVSIIIPDKIKFFNEGLSNSSLAEIKKTLKRKFRELSNELHPDKTGSKEYHRFIKMKNEYDLVTAYLSKPKLYLNYGVNDAWLFIENREKWFPPEN